MRHTICSEKDGCKLNLACAVNLLYCLFSDFRAFNVSHVYHFREQLNFVLAENSTVGDTTTTGRGVVPPASAAWRWRSGAAAGGVLLPQSGAARPLPVSAYHPKDYLTRYIDIVHASNRQLLTRMSYNCLNYQLNFICVPHDFLCVCTFLERIRARCVHSVDHLAHVFDYLRNELKSEAGKELFISYQATPVILQHFKPSNKVTYSPSFTFFLRCFTWLHVTLNS